MSDNVHVDPRVLNQLYQFRLPELKQICSTYNLSVSQLRKAEIQTQIVARLLRHADSIVRREVGELIGRLTANSSGPRSVAGVESLARRVNHAILAFQLSPQRSTALRPPIPLQAQTSTSRPSQPPARPQPPLMSLSTVTLPPSDYVHGSQQSSGGMAKSAPTQSTNVPPVQLADLPFYETQQIVLLQTQLTGELKNGWSCKLLTFQLPPTFLSQLPMNDADPLPRYEIQLRMGMIDRSAEQADNYPKQVRGSINGSPITFPPLVTVPQQPGFTQTAEQRRQSRPVDVTFMCSPYRTQPYQLTIDWQSEPTNYFVTIAIVKHLTPQILHDRIKSSRNVVYAETQQLVRKSLSGGSGEDDIAMDTLWVSLIDPLSRCPMNTPSRSRNCPHLACFDLLNFLTMNEKRPSWKCPACNKPCPFDSLVYDRYFHEIITKVGGKSNKVELLMDGWREPDSEKNPVNNKAQEVVTGWSNAGVQPKNSPVNSDASTSSGPINSNSNSTAPAPPPPPAPSVLEIITLEDSDSDDSTDDETPSGKNENSAPNSAPNSRKRTFAESNACTNPTIITLDSDGEEVDQISAVPLSNSVHVPLNCI